MAKPKAAALLAQPHPQPFTTRIVDALEDLDCHLAALEAAEQLIAPQKLGNTEDLSHVNREGLAFMFCLLNVAVRDKFNEAKALAYEAYDAMHATQS